MSKPKPQPSFQYQSKSSKNLDTRYQPIAPSKEPAYNEKLDKSEVQELKKKVQEINYMMNKRKRSVIKIQKVWRGYLARKRFAKIKGKLMQEKMQRVKKQKKKEYIRKNAKKIICTAIFNYVLKKRNQEKELLRRYVNHCATLIQKTFRGALTRIKYKQMRRKMRRFRMLLTAFVMGWKTRKILKDVTLGTIYQDIKEIEELSAEIADNDEPEAVATKEEIPWRMARLKRQYADRFYKLYYTGSWAHREDNRYRRQNQSRRTASNAGQDDYYVYKRQGSRAEPQGQENRRKQSGNDQYYNENPSRRQGEGRRSRGYDRQPSYRDQGEDEYNDQYRHSPNSPGTLGEREQNSWDNVPIRGRRNEEYNDEDYEDANSRYNRRNKKNSEPNAWDAREEIPIGGKGKYELPDEMEEPEVGQERSNKKIRKVSNAWTDREEMPIGGKGKYEIPDDVGEAPPAQKKKPVKRERDPDNAFDVKEDQPVGGKGGYVIPDDPNDEAYQGNQGGDGEVKERPKRQIAKKKKYDPRKALEEAKKKDEEGESATSKNKKSEEFRDIIRNARKFQEDKEGGDKKQEDKSAKKPWKKGKQAKKETDGEGGNNEEEEKDKDSGEGKKQEEPGDDKSFKFLKRKTKAVVSQKLDWNKVGSRVSCWVDKTKEREAPAKSPERVTMTSARPKTGNASTQNQENMRQMGNQGSARPETAAKSPMRQRGGRNERHEENIPSVKEISNEVKAEAAQQKKKKAIPANKGRGPHPAHPIKIEELEKAYNTNFLNKLNHMTQKFYSESGARDPEEEYNSVVPILRLNSAFFFRDDMDQYLEILAQLNEEYQSLQIVN